MEKEKNEKKKIKSITKKAKKIRSIVMMSLLCVLMLSAATYAWFTLSDTAKVSNLTMTVGDVTGLQIAIDNGTAPGIYGNELKYGEGEAASYGINGTLFPATLINKTDGIKKPVYDPAGSGAVTDVAAVETAEILKNDSDPSATGYYYETTFYLKSLGKNIAVQLKKGENLGNTGVQVGTETGTYVLNNIEQSSSGNGSTHIGAKAVRIWLTDGTNSIIYQPNSDLIADSNTYTLAEDKRSVRTTEAPTDVQSADGTFSTQGNLSLTANTDTKITMRIWIEGTDEFCGNEIKLEHIIAQLQFEEVTPTP